MLPAAQSAAKVYCASLLQAPCKGRTCCSCTLFCQHEPAPQLLAVKLGYAEGPAASCACVVLSLPAMTCTLLLLPLTAVTAGNMGLVTHRYVLHSPMTDCMAMMYTTKDTLATHSLPVNTVPHASHCRHAHTGLRCQHSPAGGQLYCWLQVRTAMTYARESPRSRQVPAACILKGSC